MYVCVCVLARAVIVVCFNPTIHLNQPYSITSNNPTTPPNPTRPTSWPTTGTIPPLCGLLQVTDIKVVTVALEGLENILKAGKATSDLGNVTYTYTRTCIYMHM